MNLTTEQMYKAFVERNSEYEGLFYAGVKTTGIFCRPTCTARKPKSENIEYFSSTRDALVSGYRPCKICRPLENKGEAPDTIKKILSLLEKNPSSTIKDSDIRALGAEPNAVRRWFKQNHGVTFHTFKRMLKINTVFPAVLKGTDVVTATMDSGYESISAFSDAFKTITGVNPSDADKGNIITISRFTTPLGPMIAGTSDEGLCLLEFFDRRALNTEIAYLSKHYSARLVFGTNPLLKETEKQITEYFCGLRTKFTIKIAFPGSEFQRKIWEILLSIPFGETISYKKEAMIFGNMKAVRAVANANGHNRIAIIIPCHRVLGDDGSLTGYGGGIWRKQWLIEHERKVRNQIKQ